MDEYEAILGKKPLAPNVPYKASPGEVILITFRILHTSERPHNDAVDLTFATAQEPPPNPTPEQEQIFKDNPFAGPHYYRSWYASHLPKFFHAVGHVIFETNGEIAVHAKIPDPQKDGLQDALYKGLYTLKDVAFLPPVPNLGLSEEAKAAMASYQLIIEKDDVPPPLPPPPPQPPPPPSPELTDLKIEPPRFDPAD